MFSLSSEELLFKVGCKNFANTKTILYLYNLPKTN